MAEPISSAFATYGSTEADHRSLSINNATESSLLIDQTAESYDDGSIYKYWLFLFLAIEILWVLLLQIRG